MLRIVINLTLKFKVMKRSDLFSGVLTLVIASMLISPMNLNAQDEESPSLFDVGIDFVSSYIWRGTKFGTGPAVQPFPPPFILPLVAVLLL